MRGVLRSPARRVAVDIVVSVDVETCVCRVYCVLVRTGGADERQRALRRHDVLCTTLTWAAATTWVSIGYVGGYGGYAVSASTPVIDGDGDGNS